MSKMVNELYKTSRKIGKIATKMNDLETIINGHPEKVLKRMAKRKVRKTANKKMTKILNKI